jgi:hypothetical protein
MANGDTTTAVLEAADQIDQAARALGIADVLLGDPDFDRPEVERQLLAALKLTLNALALLRAAPGRNVTPD